MTASVGLNIRLPALSLSELRTQNINMTPQAIRASSRTVTAVLLISLPPFENTAMMRSTLRSTKTIEAVPITAERVAVTRRDVRLRMMNKVTHAAITSPKNADSATGSGLSTPSAVVKRFASLEAPLS